MSDPKCPPKLQGTYNFNGKIVTHLSQDPKDFGDIYNPIPISATYVFQQSGRFFQQDRTDRPPKLGVWEKVYLGNIFQGWQALYVDTKDDSEFFKINVSKTHHNVVTEFELTSTESGFNSLTQRPKVEWGIGKRVKN